MLAEGGDYLGGRLGQSQPHCRLPTHAGPQARERAAAKRCEASAEPTSRCVGSAEAITVAEAVEKRCGASAVAIAQESGARDAEEIERAMKTAATDSMF
jgi:hypothetical protein